MCVCVCVYVCVLAEWMWECVGGSNTVRAEGRGKEGSLWVCGVCVCVCGVERAQLNVQKFGKKIEDYLSIRDSV